VASVYSLWLYGAWIQTRYNGSPKIENILYPFPYIHVHHASCGSHQQPWAMDRYWNDNPCSALLMILYTKKSSVEAAWKYMIICTVGITFALFGTILTYYGALKYWVNQAMRLIGHLLSRSQTSSTRPSWSLPLFLFSLVMAQKQVLLPCIHAPGCAQWGPNACQRPTFRSSPELRNVRDHSIPNDCI